MRIHFSNKSLRTITHPNVDDKENVLKYIKSSVKRALQERHEPIAVKFLMTAEFRYTRLERACEIKCNLENILKNGVDFGEDCHVVKTILEDFYELEIFLRGKA